MDKRCDNLGVGEVRGENKMDDFPILTPLEMKMGYFMAELKAIDPTFIL